MNQDLVNNGFIVIDSFISADRASNLRSEFLAWVDETKAIGNRQCPNSPAAYNFLPFLELLVEKAHDVTSLLCEQVLPTYSYARRYRNSGALQPH